jgi:chemotaxis protein MotB
MAKKKVTMHHEEEAGEAWLLPYSDLMTLLLAVFIVLFAVSQVDEQKATMMSDEFSGTMMTESYVIQRIDAKNQAMEENQVNDSNGVGDDDDELRDLEELKEKLDNKLVEENMLDHVETYIDKRGLVISMHNAIIFDPGKAEIKEEYEKAMLEIAEIITSTGNYIRIEGHTDNIPMNSEIYPSNWELSSARAISVVRLFVDIAKATPDKFLAVGYGEYRPVADNKTEAGRAKNRRIDIIILNEESKSMEVNI